MIELKVINKEDPLKRRVDKQTQQEEFSPMDPPDAYAPPNVEAVSYEEMHPFLQKLADEHKSAIKELEAFEETLLDIQQNGINAAVNEKLTAFFRFFDQDIAKHQQKEEKTLFPLLHRRLIEKGEHGHGSVPVTAVDMLKDDHLKTLQLAAVVFNFFGMATRLPDANSRLVMLDAALEQGKVLIELLRLHIFREDNIAFAQAQKWLKTAELDSMEMGC